MQVYKAYFKIIKQNLPAISIYVCIFLFITVMLTYFGGEKTSPGFSKTKINIAFVNDDDSAALAVGLRDYLSTNANIISIQNNEESLQDALFFRKVEYIVKVPAGFSQSFFSGEHDVRIEKTSVQKSQSSVYMDFLINRYLSTAGLYTQNMPGISGSQLLGFVKSDLEQQTSVQVKAYGKKTDSRVATYYTYLVYAMIVIIFLGVTSIMLVFNDPDLRKRNLGSPLKSLSMNMQLFLGNMSFAVVVWIIMVTIGFLISGKAAFDINSVMMYINLLCFAFVCLSLSFLIGNLIRSREVQQGIANVLSLGLCFIGGVFVPQQLLGKTVNFIASFTPTYWYVKAVNDIEKLALINITNVTPIINSMLIQLGFVVALLAVALVIAKQKRVSA
ncbi:MAG: ABC transporter permease [Firmicutes bacterium HGW-Firmicutes-15]|nr:MAG: ABC transporter permease [Firmicutes bacterium HGW-Firmicutes-15]